MWCFKHRCPSNKNLCRAANKILSMIYDAIFMIWIVRNITVELIVSKLMQRKVHTLFQTYIVHVFIRILCSYNCNIFNITYSYLAYGSKKPDCCPIELMVCVPIEIGRAHV